jgi:hypothetical protein
MCGERKVAADRHGGEGSAAQSWAGSYATWQSQRAMGAGNMDSFGGEVKRQNSNLSAAFRPAPGAAASISALRSPHKKG